MNTHRQKGTQLSQRQQRAKATSGSGVGVFAVLSNVFGFRGSSAGCEGGVGGGTALLGSGLLTLAVTALLTLSVSSASALTTRQLQTQITGTCPTPGNCSASERIPFGELAGVAVDSSSKLWVADYLNHAVDRFGPTGSYEAQNVGAGSWGEDRVESLAYSAAVDELFASDSANEGHLFGLDPATAAFSGKDFALALGGGIKVAADNSAGATGGDLYVSTGSAVLRIKASTGADDPFAESGNPAFPYISGNELTGPFVGPGSLAVGPGGNLFVAGFTAVYEFGPSGELVREISEVEGSPLEAFALAVDPTSGNLLVARFEAGAYVIDEFSPTGAFERRISEPGGVGFAGLRALAVDSHGTAYLSESPGEGVKRVAVLGPLVTLPDVTTGTAEVHSTTAATLHGEVNPADREVTECFFEYGPTTAYGATVPCAESAAEIGSGNLPVEVHADLTGLAPGATYHYRLVAANSDGANSESGDQTLFTGAGIVSTFSSQVTAGSARLETELNPHGVLTTYHFEYDTAPYLEGGPAHGTGTPVTSAGSGTVALSRSAPVQGLLSATTYHFRVVAENALGVVDGPDRSFITQGAALGVLPDGRAWEMVSPPDKNGVPLEPLSVYEGSLIQAAVDGSGLAYVAAGSISSPPAGNRSPLFSQLLATRGPGGWSTEDVSTPHGVVTPLVVGRRVEYDSFATELALGLVAPAGDIPLSPYTSERTPYLRQADGKYTPLVIGCPELPQPCPPAVQEHANVPPGTHFGGEERFPGFFGGGVGVVTATPDLAHIALVALTPLTGFTQPQAEMRSYYEWSAGSLSLISQIPPPSVTSCGGSGPACHPAAEAGIESQLGGPGLENLASSVLSDDGERSVFNTEASPTAGVNAHLYLRDAARGETLQLDAPQGGSESSAAEPRFQGADADGSRIYFTDTAPLTADSIARSGAADLYECHISAPSSAPLGCDLIDLTANAVHPSEPAAVLGLIPGASADGSSVYFVAQGALTASPNSDGEAAVSGNCSIEAGSNGPIGHGACNLYRYDTVTEALELVAVLSGQDFNDWGGASWPTVGKLGSLTAGLTADGSYLAFTSDRPLTGYDNRDAVSGLPDQEVYLFHAPASPGAQATLRCVSCNPAGARPHGSFERTGERPFRLADGSLNWEGQSTAAFVPGWSSTNVAGDAIHRSRYLSSSGRLFFDASDALVPQDSNGTGDVYEYEPPGVGSCTASNPTYSPASGGCVDLISSGTSGQESVFLEASESGDDVFFLTASQLVRKDVDTAQDIYDAHICSAASPCPPAETARSPECDGDACQQPAVPPNDATPGSLTFNGAGNELQCPKGKVKKSGKCVAKKHKGKKHQKKSNKKKGKKQKNKRTNANRGGAK